jgi:hypothetical protein
MTKDEISDIVELMSLNYGHLTDTERETFDRVNFLDAEGVNTDNISSNDFEVMRKFVPVLSERKAKILNWIELDESSRSPFDEMIVFIPIGHKNLEQIIGMSSSEFVDKLMTNIDDHGRRNHIDERKNIDDTLIFMDFYIRFANNSATEQEIFERIEDLANKVDSYLKDDSVNNLYGYKKRKLRDIFVLLRSGEYNNKMRDKIRGLEEFINFSHFVEPTIIPHVFGCINSSGILQSFIIHVLNTLANSNKEEHEEKHKWILERNSEHRRKILKPMKRKKVQEVTKRHIFRKNVSG